jgi:hypothetical protein
MHKSRIITVKSAIHKNDIQRALKKRNHGKKPGNPTTCCGDEWSAGLEATAPVIAFSLEEPRSKLRGSSLAELIEYMRGRSSHIYHTLLRANIFNTLCTRK